MMMKSSSCGHVKTEQIFFKARWPVPSVMKEALCIPSVKQPEALCIQALSQAARGFVYPISQAARGFVYPVS